MSKVTKHGQVFTQRHYEWLADWVIDLRRIITDERADDIARHLSDRISKQHPKFDSLKFYKRAKVKLCC